MYYNRIDKKAKFIITAIIIFALYFKVWSQDNPGQTETDKYIAQYKEIAVKEMHRAKIPASIIMAQAILESSLGESYVARVANNHFGIKCGSSWTGDKIFYDDDDKNECFRKYNSVEESFQDHSDYLVSKPRYESLFKLSITDYQQWAKGLKETGYATRSNYDELLIGIIEKYKLTDLDKLDKEVPKNVSNTKQQPQQQFKFNGILAIMVKWGDTYESIASANKLDVNELKEYNDISKDVELKSDMILYLKSKKNKSKESYHIYKSGETLWQISQDCGIKLNSLYSLNLMAAGQTPVEGEIIYLKHKRKDPPNLQSNNPQPNKPPVKPKEEKGNQNKKEVVSFFGGTQDKDTVHKNDFVMTKKDTVQVNNKAREKQDIIPPPQPPVKPIASNIQELTNTTTKPNDVKAPEVSNPNFHIVKKGETLFSISKLYGLKVDELKSINNLTDNNLKIGMKLLVNKALASRTINKIPQSPVFINNTKTPSDSNEDTLFHIVKPGETFYSISRIYHVRITQMINLNRIQKYDLDVGKKLIIKLPHGAEYLNVPFIMNPTNPYIIPENPKQQISKTVTEINKIGETEGDYYYVDQGESLFSISKKFNTTIDKLKELNNLNDNAIKVGQKLKIK